MMPSTAGRLPQTPSPGQRLPLCVLGSRSEGLSEWGLRCGLLAGGDGELAAGGGDVSAAVLAHQRRDAAGDEQFAEGLYPLGARIAEAQTRVLVVGDQVHLRLQATQQIREAAGVVVAIVHPAQEHVLESHPPALLRG